VNAYEFPVLKPMGDWPDRAACKGYPQHIFFPERGDSTSEAKAICRTCPVIGECLDWAKKAPEKYGVWGGQSPKKRRGGRVWVCQDCRGEIAGVGRAYFCGPCGEQRSVESHARSHLNRTSPR
jgi:hypothetical protein